jgi:hypothetical protein
MQDPATELRTVIQQVRRRWRMKLAIRGALAVLGIGFVVFLVSASALEAARFSPGAILTARAGLALAIAALVAFFFVKPLIRRVSDEQVALYLEEHEPTLQEAIISSRHLEARLVEALPWLLVNYPKLDWRWLLREAKVNDLQNRLGFVVNVAREVAEKRGSSDAAEVLRHWEGVLENSRLQKEDTFAQGGLTEAERKWLRSNRSKAAAHWNLLTSMSAETVANAF